MKIKQINIYDADLSDELRLESLRLAENCEWLTECKCNQICRAYEKQKEIIVYLPTNDNGYCCCSSCQFADLKNCIIHDIILEWKGAPSCAIEIINKHYPKWKSKIRLPYPVYIIKAENILKRVSDTDVFVSEIINKGDL